MIKANPGKPGDIIPMYRDDPDFNRGKAAGLTPDKSGQASRVAGVVKEPLFISVLNRFFCAYFPTSHV